MEYKGPFYALLTAIGFKTSELTERLLQEKGAAPIDTYTIYRYALIPSLIWSIIFVRKEDLVLILHSPKLVIIFGLIIIFWNLQTILMSFVINSTSSMILLATIFNMLALPMFLIFGTFFNGDIPNIYSISGIIILLLALFINPAHHHENLRPKLSKPLYIIMLLILAKVACDTVLQGISREALQEIHPTVFLGVFSSLTLSVCWIISTLFIRRRIKEKTVMRKKRLLALVIPMVWFIASIPEAFALAAIPIYTFISISVITFGMDTFSDVIHKRIHINFQSIIFIVLVLSGISLSVLSI
jgi:hypothetical protein